MPFAALGMNFGMSIDISATQRAIYTALFINKLNSFLKLKKQKFWKGGAVVPTPPSYVPVGTKHLIPGFRDRNTFFWL